MTASEVALPLQRRAPAARPFARRGRSVETLLVVLIVGIVIFEALQGFRSVEAKIQVLNAISLSSTERTEAVTALAATGALPDRILEHPVRGFPGARPIFGRPEWRDGELVFPATERLSRLLTGDADGPVRRDAAVAFRVARASDSGAIVWLCGSENAPTGFEALPPRHTTIPSRYLPHFCR